MSLHLDTKRTVRQHPEPGPGARRGTAAINPAEEVS
jgi:hypothetical protein